MAKPATPVATPAATPAAATPPQKVSKKMIWIAIIGALIITYLSWPEQTAEEKARAASKQNTAASQPTSGVIDAVPGVWQGITCLDGTKQISYSILMDNVYWKVRFDHDDRRIRSMYPRNFNPGSVDPVTVPCNTVEFMIITGQVASSAPIAWSFVNK